MSHTLERSKAMKSKKESYESPEMHLFLMPATDIITTSGPFDASDDPAGNDVKMADWLKGRKH